MSNMDGNGASPFSGRERRKVQRQPALSVPRLSLDLDGRKVAATPADISIQGIGLVVDVPVSPGVELSIGFPERPRPDLKVQVRHRRAWQNKWLLGCALSRLLRMEDFEAME